MTGKEVRQRFLDYMTKNGHVVIPSSGLIPENDPSTLFTGSGMQPLIPYLMGEKHPSGTRLANSQKCFRAEDIEEVGDNRHTTFFEMLGNWSLGDYFKKEQLSFFYNFLINEIKLDPNKIYISVFRGDDKNNLPKDEESTQIWQNILKKQGVSNQVADLISEEEASKRGIREGERIFYYDANKNWWSRIGAPDNMPVGEIGGPDSEIFYDFGTEHDTRFGEYCHPNCDCGRFIELGNSVFMQYQKTHNGFVELPQKNVDFGGGLERIVAATNNESDVFKIDLLWSVIEKIEKLTGKKYQDNPTSFRIISDHIRGAVFMIADDVLPANTEQGYFVRRLLRRAVQYADKISLPEGYLSQLAGVLITKYQNHFIEIDKKHEKIENIIREEEAKFRKTLAKGLKQFEKISLQIHLSTDKDTSGKKVLSEKAILKKSISAQNAFNLFTTYGFPIELTQEIATEKGLVVDIEGFKKLMLEHKEKSRSGSEQKFKGGLANHSEQVIQYHTATHLLLAALRKFLGKDVHQAGSNITAERLRFDFTYPEKIDKEILNKIADWVNYAIKKGAKVTIETMSKQNAESDPSIEGSFWDRYPEQVKVYTITSDDGEVFSRELCGGPHVQHLSEIEGKFVIKKESSSAAGIRRIKAVLEKNNTL